MTEKIILSLLINLILLFFCLKYFLQKKILIHKTFGLAHKHNNKKKKLGNDILLIGGVYIFISVLLNYFFFYKENIISIIIFYLIPIFLVGVFSDIKKDLSPKLRLIVFFIASCSFLLSSQIFISSIDFKIIDLLLKYNIFSIFFFSFCICIVINGFNFFDGINGNALVHFLIINTVLAFAIDKFDKDLFYFFISVSLSIIPLLILNFQNKIFLGDNGAYIIGFYISSIILYLKNSFNLNSYFIAVLLLYPAFEVLWSIIRKTLENKNVMKPDLYHMHNVLYAYLKIKNHIINHICSTLLISSYNLFFIIFAYFNIDDKVILIKLTSFYVVSYVTIYLLLRLSLSDKNK